MLNKLNELRKGKEEGFTLIELLVVILIIGVLSAIALPIFLNQQKEATKASVKSDVRNTVTNVATFLVSKPTATVTEMNATGGVAIVKSGKGAGQNSIVIGPAGGDYKNYTVTGSNGGVADWTYVFDSVTGTYDEVIPTPAP